MVAGAVGGNALLTKHPTEAGPDIVSLKWPSLFGLSIKQHFWLCNIGGRIMVMCDHLCWGVSWRILKTGKDDG